MLFTCLLEREMEFIHMLRVISTYIYIYVINQPVSVIVWCNLLMWRKTNKVRKKRIKSLSESCENVPCELGIYFNSVNSIQHHNGLCFHARLFNSGYLLYFESVQTFITPFYGCACNVLINLMMLLPISVALSAPFHTFYHVYMQILLLK